MTLVVACVLACDWCLSYGRTQRFAIDEIVIDQISHSEFLEISDGYIWLKTGKLRVGETIDWEENVVCELPYWSIILPLTLISAWLLLRKPRPAKRSTSPWILTMRELFRGRRRKLGVVVLGLTCVLACDWCISYGQTRRFVTDQTSRYEFIEISEGYISLKTTELKAVQGTRFGFWGPTIYFEDNVVFEIPFWSFVLPPALLSAWLLLSNPRPPQTTTSEVFR